MKKIFILSLGIMLLGGCQNNFLTPDLVECEPIPPPRGDDLLIPYEEEWYGEHQFRDPDFNPNNPNEVVFKYKEIEGGLWKIGIGKLDTRTFRFLTFGEEPSWSVNDEIAFVDELENGIMKINSDGTGLKRLTNGPRHYHPSWGPNGDKVVYENASSDSAAVLYLMDREGNYLGPVKERSRGGWPVWSPDGTKIAYGASALIRTYNLVERDSFEWRLPLEDYGSLREFAWFQDSKRLIGCFGSRLSIFDLSQRTEFLLRESCLRGRQYLGVGLSPDGQKILASRRDMRRINGERAEVAVQLWVMDIDGSNEEILELKLE